MHVSLAVDTVSWRLTLLCHSQQLLAVDTDMRIHAVLLKIRRDQGEQLIVQTVRLQQLAGLAIRCLVRGWLTIQVNVHKGAQGGRASRTWLLPPSSPTG